MKNIIMRWVLPNLKKGVLLYKTDYSSDFINVSQHFQYTYSMVVVSVEFLK